MSVNTKDKNSQKTPAPVASEKAPEEENFPIEAKVHASARHDKTKALCIILGLVIVIAMLIYAYPRLSGLLGLSQSTVNSEMEIMNRIQHLEDHTKKLKDEVEEVQQHGTATDNQVAAEVAAVQRFEKRLQHLEEWQQQQSDLKVGPQEESPLAIPHLVDENLKSKIQELTERSEKLAMAQQNLKRYLQRLPEIIQDFSLLRMRVQSAQPFIRELASVVRHVDKTLDFLAPSLKLLENYAARGIPTLNQLKEEFAHALKVSTLSGREDTLGWWERYKKALGNLVVVQKTNSDVPHMENSILQLSQAKLAQGDLQGAFSLIEKLNMKEFETWCAHAAARTQVDQILPKLEAAPFAMLLKEIEGSLPSSSGYQLSPLSNSK